MNSIEHMVRKLVNDRAAEPKTVTHLTLRPAERVRIRVADAYLPRHSLQGIFVDQRM